MNVRWLYIAMSLGLFAVGCGPTNTVSVKPGPSMGQAPVQWPAADETPMVVMRVGDHKHVDMGVASDASTLTDAARKACPGGSEALGVALDHDREVLDWKRDVFESGRFGLLAVIDGEATYLGGSSDSVDGRALAASMLEKGRSIGADVFAFYKSYAKLDQGTQFSRKVARLTALAYRVDCSEPASEAPTEAPPSP